MKLNLMLLAGSVLVGVGCAKKSGESKVAASAFDYETWEAPEGEVTIEQIAYGGSGCPQGSVAEMVAPDKKAFTLLFDEYTAEIGPSVPLRENRKNCQVAVTLKYPQGWSFSLASFDYRGYVALDKTVTGTQKTSYYFQGNAKTGSFSSEIKGEYDNDFHFRDVIGLEATIWSPCGETRALNINSQVRLAAKRRDATGVMTLDSIDGALVHKYGLVWQRCKNR